MPFSLAIASSVCRANHMHSLAWRPCLVPAVHYWVRQGNGRLSFCQSCLLEMQNVISIVSPHLLLLHPQFPSIPCTKVPAMKLNPKTDKLLSPPPALVNGSLPLNQWPMPSLSERCASLQTPHLSLLLHQTCWWDLKSSEPGHTAQVTRLSAESVSHPHCGRLSLTPNKSSTALLHHGFKRFS